MALTSRAATFGDDAAFLSQHTKLVVLSDPSGAAKVAVAPELQGRVMTSTAGGNDGASFGWINYALFTSGKKLPHINAYGGEDRFWMGPEGGQFSLFFQKGAPFDLAHWQTPEALDTMAYPVAEQRADGVTVEAQFELTNFSGEKFQVGVRREVKLLPAQAAYQLLKVAPAPEVKMVAYESDNTITNKGSNPWKRETGLVSIWILGQFQVTPETTIVVPFRSGPEGEMGTKLTSNYFGEIPADRLKVTDDVAFFSGDGNFRSKIGVNPRRSKGILGSYDGVNKVLSIVQFDQPRGVTDYVNSLWKIQDYPYAGDAENSYNDGPPAPGVKPLGPFYEMESSSPAAALAAGESMTHVHRTMHLSGPEAALDAIAKSALGVSLREITTALKP